MTADTAQTVTSAATAYIEGAPTAAGSLSITNAYALWVDDGLVRLDGDLDVDGVTNLDTVDIDGTVDILLATTMHVKVDR